jgi:hypothetical protein
MFLPVQLLREFFTITVVQQQTTERAALAIRFLTYSECYRYEQFTRLPPMLTKDFRKF